MVEKFLLLKIGGVVEKLGQDWSQRELTCFVRPIVLSAL